MSVVGMDPQGCGCLVLDRSQSSTGATTIQVPAGYYAGAGSGAADPRISTGVLLNTISALWEGTAQIPAGSRAVTAAA